MSNTQQEGRLRSVSVIFPEHDKIVLTNERGDTYTSKSEELIDFFTALPSPLTVDELKQKFAQHLGVKELETSDAYAVEWTVKELNIKQ